MNNIDYDNFLWSTEDINVQREYNFYYKDYTKNSRSHHSIKCFSGTVNNFLNFSHHKVNIILCKVEEINIFESAYSLYEVAANRLSYEYDGYIEEEKQKRIAARRNQKQAVYSKRNNNWNCRNYNRRYK